ncbi:MAG: TetR/AcrR family transcriptional regulator C-terminal domain-containing protein [Lachnospiraceae bacterium]|nr:TetR/AcrR family transcriptional regulator C-terminal domain-containing protein [Lachnospiraceae bacterium]
MSETTKLAIASSFKKLLRKKSLTKITVKDIVEGCGINRQTFYYHFKDVYDLMEWIFIEEAKILLDGKKGFSSWKEDFLRIFDYLQVNHVLIYNAYNSMSRDSLERYILKVTRPLLCNFASEISVNINISEDDKNFVIDVFSFAMMGIMLEWIENKMPKSYSNSIDKFVFLIDGSMEGALKKFESKG